MSGNYLDHFVAWCYDDPRYSTNLDKWIEDDLERLFRREGIREVGRIKETWDYDRYPGGRIIGVELLVAHAIDCPCENCNEYRSPPESTRRQTGDSALVDRAP